MIVVVVDDGDDGNARRCVGAKHKRDWTLPMKSVEGENDSVQKTDRSRNQEQIMRTTLACRYINLRMSIGIGEDDDDDAVESKIGLFAASPRACKCPKCQQ